MSSAKTKAAQILFLMAAAVTAAWGEQAHVHVLPGTHPDYSIFIGNYGETFEFDNGQTVEAAMHGPVEVVRIHETSQHVPGSHIPVLFNPTEEDFKPENFARFGLRELMIIPKGLPGGYKTLAELKAAKLVEISSASVIFHVLNRPQGSLQWPPGSFEVVTDVPYSLWQIYSESPKYFFIFSMGVNPYSYNGPREDTQLAIWLHDSFQRTDWSELALNRRELMAWLASNGVFLLIAGLPIALWQQRRRILGLSLISFCNGLFIYAYVLCAAEQALGLGLVKTAKVVEVSALVIATAAALLVARRLRARNLGTVSAAMIATASYLVYEVANSQSAALSRLPLDIGVAAAGTLFIVGMLMALIYGILLRPAAGEGAHEG